MDLLFLLILNTGRQIKIIIMGSNCKTCNCQKDKNELLVEIIVSRLFVIIHRIAMRVLALLPSLIIKNLPNLKFNPKKEFLSKIINTRKCEFMSMNRNPLLRYNQSGRVTECVKN